MTRNYAAYLKDSTLDPKKGQCIDAAFYPADNEEEAILIAQARWQEELTQPNRMVSVDDVTPSGPLMTYIDEDEDD